MSELYRKSLLKLELDQVLEKLAECAGSLEGKAACRNLRPSSDLEDVRMMLEQTTAASDLCIKKGNPGFGEVRDVSASLERAALAGNYGDIFPHLLWVMGYALALLAAAAALFLRQMKRQ